MNTLEQDEDLIRTLRALHARLDVLEATFFSKMTDAAKKAASAVANTASKAVDYVLGDQLTPENVSAHLQSTFPEMKIYDFTKKGWVKSWLLIYKDKEFFLREDQSPLRGAMWKFMSGVRIKAWNEDHTPKVLDVSSIKVDRWLSNFKGMDKYIREHAP